MADGALFEVLGQVARTHGSVVLKARDVGLGRVVALKRVDAARAESLRAEARALGALSSPHVVAVHDLVEDASGAYLVEEWVDGATLAAVVAERSGLDVDQALGVTRGALLGLADVHRAGLVHGDVSTGNILVDGTGSATLIDFGSVTGIGSAARPATGAFASPEARSGGPVTAASDVFAAAAVLASLLSDGALRTPGRIDLSSIEEPVRAVLARATAADPAARYPDAGEFLDALAGAAERRYGAGWWTEAGLTGLGGVAAGLAVEVARTAAMPHQIGAATGVAGRAGVASVGPGVEPGVDPGIAASTRALPGVARRSGSKALLVGGAAAVLVIGGAASAVALHHRGSSSGARAATTSASHVSPSPNPTPAPQDSAPSGRYRFVDAVSTTHRNGTVTHPHQQPGPWTFGTPQCSGSVCTGANHRLGRGGLSYTWKGGVLTITDTRAYRYPVACGNTATGKVEPHSEGYAVQTDTHRYAPAAIGGSATTPPASFSIVEHSRFRWQFFGDCQASPTDAISRIDRFTLTRVG